MGTRQRTHRKLREAMRREGEPLPSLRAARRRHGWRWVVACGKAAAAVTRLMVEINAIKSKMAAVNSAALGLPPNETITITNVPDPLSIEEIAKVMQSFAASSGGRIKFVV